MPTKVRRIDLSFDEFIAGTAHLSDVELGIYWRACLFIYSGGGAITEDILRRVCTSQQRTYQRVLAMLIETGKLIETEGKLTQNRCQTELKHAANRMQTASENVQKRWSKRLENNKTVDTDVLLAGNANHQPPTINHQESPHNPPKGNFSVWWQKCPHKVGKRAAETAYRQALARASPEELDAGIDRYRITKPPDRPWCNPATWLNQDRWKDEPDFTNGADRSAAAVSQRRTPREPPPEVPDPEWWGSGQ